MTVLGQFAFNRILRRECAVPSTLLPPHFTAHRPRQAQRALIHSRRTLRSTRSAATAHDLPLAGVRVLEVGQVIAGPFCGQLLGYVCILPPQPRVLISYVS